MTYIYIGQKYPHIYTLSISIGKNQSTKVRGASYILTYEYNCKVITGCDTILQEYYITDNAQLQKYKEMYKYEQYKGRSRVTTEKLESRTEGLEGKDSGRSADDPCYCCATLINKQKNSQAPSSGHKDLRESELSNER